MHEYGRADRATPVLVVLLVVAFLLMTFDIRSRGGGLSETLRVGTQTLFTPVQKATTAVVDPVADFIDGLANLAGLRAENERLRRQVDQLQARVAKVEQLEAELELYRQALDLASEQDTLPSVAAEVIARVGNLDLTFTISKGSDHGVLVGNPVVDENGYLVGTVTEVAPTSAMVIPIVDRQQGVQVMTRHGEPGIVLGTGAADLLELRILDAEEPVFADDLVWTAGSAAYPPDIQVGVVLETSRPEAGLVRTTVRPLADVERVRVVRVLSWPPPDEAPTIGSEEATP